MRDKLFDQTGDLVNFAFDQQVVAVFDDMVKRSVPGYQTLLEITALLVKTYGQNHSNYYDLGASTGAISLALGLNDDCCGTQIIAIDNSPEMSARCQQNLAGKVANFQVICADINDIVIQNASIVVLNLTLQFILPALRDGLINKIHRGLNKGGILLIAEKIHFKNRAREKLTTQLHLNFKRANGYSALEIANKRQLLENILITEDAQTHLNRLNTAGFEQSLLCFQYLNFAAFLAIK